MQQCPVLERIWRIGHGLAATAQSRALVESARSAGGGWRRARRGGAGVRRRSRVGGAPTRIPRGRWPPTLREPAGEPDRPQRDGDAALCREHDEQLGVGDRHQHELPDRCNRGRTRPGLVGGPTRRERTLGFESRLGHGQHHRHRARQPDREPRRRHHPGAERGRRHANSTSPLESPSRRPARRRTWRSRRAIRSL